MTVAVKQEVRVLSSRYANQALMYSGKWLLTWMKPPFMPWMLAKIEPYTGA